MSLAVGIERVSKVVGYKLTAGDFSNTTSNLPQRVVILGEANTADQLTLDTTQKEITSSQQAGQLYGYGSPIYQVMRILRPSNGGGIGGIPTIVMPQTEPVGAAAKVIDIQPIGTATANGTHTIVLSGREGLDGQFFNINILKDDTPVEIKTKITDTINNVLGASVTAVDQAAPDRSELTTKWAGLTANDVNVEINTNDTDLGVTYTITEAQAGSGTPDISGALAQFGNAWNTIVINTYGTNDQIMDALEAFNGRPDPNTPTGRYTGIVFKPFIAITGSTADDPSAITDLRKEDVTIAIAPAPLSDGLQFEAAANMARLAARQMQDSPHLDVSGQFYPDMPTPDAIGSMETYDNRDAIVKKGSSTVELVSGQYKVADFVTTYHPDGEVPPQFRYCRNLNIDWNIRYGYFLREQINVVDHAIADDNDIVTASTVIKPKQWKAILFEYAEDLTSRALIVQTDFMKDSITVNLSNVNPDRLEVFFRYKRSGFARIVSTTGEAGFNFGEI